MPRQCLIPVVPGGGRSTFFPSTKGSYLGSAHNDSLKRSTYCLRGARLFNLAHYSHLHLSKRRTPYRGIGRFFSMAWTCSGRTNDELIDRLFSKGLIQSEVVANAMRKVDRRNYVPDTGSAYQDSPQRIGFNATISAPHMHAHALENLLPLLPPANKKGGAILDVGSGSGYLTAVLHHLAPHATVVGIDHLQGLVDLAKDNLAKDGIKLGTGEGQVEIVYGDGRLVTEILRLPKTWSALLKYHEEEGLKISAPFQIIHVGAAAPEIPQALIDQLGRPGRMFIPVGVGSQDIWQVDKDENGDVTRKKLFGVLYVPLTDAGKQWREG